MSYKEEKGRECCFEEDGAFVFRFEMAFAPSLIHLLNLTSASPLTDRKDEVLGSAGNTKRVKRNCVKT